MRAQSDQAQIASQAALTHALCSLSILGYRVGARLLELLPLRDYLYPVSSLRSPPPPTRTLRLLPILTYIHSTLYRYLFGRPADSLERSTENDDEYMIGDDDMVITRGVEVPKEMSDLSCAALVAGIVEAVMDGAGFVSCCPLFLVASLTALFDVCTLPYDSH